MIDSKINLDPYVQETHQYLNNLSKQLGHPDEQQRTAIIWKAVMHTVRDRISIAESMDILSALPVILKGWYTLGWSYSETPPLEYDSIEGMKIKVKELQNSYGESDFDWNIHTEEIISITLDSLAEYLSEDHLRHIKANLPEDVKPVMA